MDCLPVIFGTFAGQLALFAAIAVAVVLLVMPRLDRAVLCAGLGVGATVALEYSRGEEHVRRHRHHHLFLLDAGRLLPHHSAQVCRALLAASAPLLTKGSDGDGETMLQQHQQFWCAPLEDADATALLFLYASVLFSFCALVLLKVGGGSRGNGSDGRRRLSWIISCAAAFAIVTNTFEAATVSSYISDWLRSVIDLRVVLRWACAKTTGVVIGGIGGSAAQEGDSEAGGGSAADNFASNIILIWGDWANEAVMRVCVPWFVMLTHAAYSVFVVLHVRELLQLHT